MCGFPVLSGFTPEKKQLQWFAKVGQIPIGDATGGAVHHTGNSVDYTARVS